MAFCIIQDDEIYCSICYDILNDPIECQECQTNFCRECVEVVKKKNKEKKIENKCPLCKKEWNLKENIVFREILLKNIQRICKKCKKLFSNKNDFDEHIKKCKLYKCKICHKIKFINDDEFLQHIKDNHKEIIINCSNKNFKGDPFPKEIDNSILNKKNKLNTIEKINQIDYTIFDNNISSKNTDNTSKNIFDNNSNNNSNNNSSNNSLKFKSKGNEKGIDMLKSNYIEGQYINLFRPNNEIPIPNEEIRIPTDKILSKNKLYYCGKRTNLNCDCCPDGRCKENNCLCINCMNFNKEYKYLKDYYLINKFAKAAKFQQGSFRCLAEYTIIDKINGIKLKKQLKCIPPNEPCPGCKALNKLYKKYLNPEIYNTFN